MKKYIIILAAASMTIAGCSPDGSQEVDPSTIGEPAPTEPFSKPEPSNEGAPVDATDAGSEEPTTKAEK